MLILLRAMKNNFVNLKNCHLCTAKLIADGRRWETNIWFEVVATDWKKLHRCCQLVSFAIDSSAFAREIAILI